MKKIFILLLILALCILSFAACDAIDTETHEGTAGLEYYPLPNGTYSVSIGTAKDLEQIIIPAMHNGKAVTIIPEEAFVNANNLKSITIPNSITSIGEFAFSGCTKLTNVTIPDSVTRIGKYAFSDCTSLTSLTVGNGVTSVGDNVFYNCENLSYNKHDNAYYLGNDENPYLLLVKTNNTSITSCEIHKYTRIILDSAFYKCKNLREIIIPNNVISIGFDAFTWCEELTSVTIGKNVTNIGDFSFSYCPNLTSLTIPSSVTSIGIYAFSNCKKLSSITFHGTKEQWNTVSKGIDWNYNTGSYTITCTDGTVRK